jgi:hypothetical protein
MGETSMNDVQLVVMESMKIYQSKYRKSKARKWLHYVASRIHYYGNVMDVLVQHHPEYVSLAWGAMKFLFVVRSTPSIVRNISRL